MAQRPRLSQLKRTDINYRTFHEQYEELEREAKFIRKPVATFGELPLTSNRDGETCLVKEEGIIYSWDETLQNWRSIVGKGYDVPSGRIKRYKKKFIATAGQTQFVLDFRYELGEDVLDVYIQGMLQTEGVDYFETDERTVTFVEPLQANMEIVFVMPYIVGGAQEVSDLQRRLESIEHNHYQLMLQSYYEGKPVESRSLVFDGFKNTSYIDYIETTNTIEYDSIFQSMKLKENAISRIHESFDSTSNMSSNSTIRTDQSEATLPILSTFASFINDSFDTVDQLNLDASTAYYNIIDGYITTTDIESGGDHYYKGDFMTTTGNAYLWQDNSWGGRYGCGVMSRNGYYYINNNSYTQIKYALETNNEAWVTALYASGNSGNTSTSQIYLGGASGWDFVRHTACFSPRDDNMYGVQSYSQGTGVIYQTIWRGNMSGYRDVNSWTHRGWPNGMPSGTGGSGVDSANEVVHFGCTENELLIHIKDIVYFVDIVNWVVTKELDWTGKEKVPSKFSYRAKQMTADARYLYFPSYQSGTYYNKYTWWYGLEVFDRNTGEYITFTPIYDAHPYNTGLCFDWTYKRLLIGVEGYYHYKPYNKDWYTRRESSYQAAILSFTPPELNYYYIESKPLITNLPTVYYQLEVSEELNGGTVEYYIQLDKSSWIKIHPNQTGSWTNPNRSQDVEVKLRAKLKAGVGSSTAPRILSWNLKIKPFADSALYESNTYDLSLVNVTGGRVVSTKYVPTETSLQWTVQLDSADPEIIVSEDGTLSIPEGLSQGMVILRGKLGTNNPFRSPIIKDVRLDLNQVEAGVLASNTYEQLEDIDDVTLWVTTGTSHEYYIPYVSRDGGISWIPAVLQDSLKLNSGKVESKFYARFDTTDGNHRQLKIRFELQGATEIFQYGAFINAI